MSVPPEDEQFLRDAVDKHRAANPGAKPEETKSFALRALQIFKGRLADSPPAQMARAVRSGLQLATDTFGAVGATGRNAASAAMGAEDFSPGKALVGGFKGDPDAPGNATTFHKTLNEKAPGLEQSVGRVVLLGTGVGALAAGDAPWQQDVQKFVGATATDAAVDPSTYASFGGGSAAKAAKAGAKGAAELGNVGSKFARMLKLSGVVEADAAKAAKVAQALYADPQMGAATGGFSKTLKRYFLSRGGTEEVFNKVAGSNAEFINNPGLKVGVPFMSDKFGMEVAPAITKLSGGKIPENLAGRAGEKIARSYGIDAPKHTRQALENARQALAHGTIERKDFDRLSRELLSGNQGALNDAELAGAAQTYKVRNPIFKAGNAINNVLKSNVLAKTGFPVMNFTDDIIRAISAGAKEPAALAKGVQAFMDAPKDRILFLTPSGRPVPAREIQEVAQQFGYGHSSRTAPEGKFGKVQQAAQDVLTLRTGRVLNKVNNTWDKYSRVALYIDGLMQGESPASAVARVRETLTDPIMKSANPRIARHVEPLARPAIPFAGFGIRTAESVPKMLLKRPDIAAAFSHLQNAGDVTNPEAQRRALPAFRSQDNIPIAIPKEIGKAGGTPEGSQRYLQLRGNPLEDISAPMDMLPIPQIAENGDISVNGVSNYTLPIQLLYQALSGKDPLTGANEKLSAKPFWAGTTDTALDAAGPKAGQKASSPILADKLSSYAIPPLQQNLANRAALKSGAPRGWVGYDQEFSTQTKRQSEEDARANAQRALDLKLWGILLGSRQFEDNPARDAQMKKDQEKADRKKNRRKRK